MNDGTTNEEELGGEVVVLGWNERENFLFGDGRVEQTQTPHHQRQQRHAPQHVAPATSRQSSPNDMT